MDTTPSPRTPRPIVVGVDGSEQSIAALHLAARLIPLAGDTIRAVSVWQFSVGLSPYAPMDWHPDEVAEACLDQALATAFPDELPYPIERRVRQGSAAQVLIDESRDASMVVVGSRGHGGFVGLLLGSVSSSVAERSACPVLIAHGVLQPLQPEDVGVALTDISA